MAGLETLVASVALSMCSRRGGGLRVLGTVQVSLERGSSEGTKAESERKAQGLT